MKELLASLSPMRSIIKRWLVQKFHSLTSQDGKPGLQVSDLEAIAAVAVEINKQWTAAAGREKALLLADWIGKQFPSEKIPVWVIGRVAECAYDYAILKGWIKKN